MGRNLNALGTSLVECGYGWTLSEANNQRQMDKMYTIKIGFDHQDLFWSRCNQVGCQVSSRHGRETCQTSSRSAKDSSRDILQRSLQVQQLVGIYLVSLPTRNYYAGQPTVNFCSCRSAILSFNPNIYLPTNQDTKLLPSRYRTTPHPLLLPSCHLVTQGVSLKHSLDFFISLTCGVKSCHMSFDWSSTVPWTW